ncbi:MAG TPA: MotA/TolQ/ExbB proton channel family protein [Opitutaceae bacterium]|nr:MotA/TolQ/ExbB proton channel family protein [Opitutaceae bacterium]
MISRNKGILSLDFLVPTIAFIVSLVLVEFYFSRVVRPAATALEIRARLMAAQATDKPYVQERSIYLIIKDYEQEAEIIFFFWSMAVLIYKLRIIVQERKLLKYDFVRINSGERIIPEDALDRYKDLKSSVERQPLWRERLLPDFILTALHRFQMTRSIPDASAAVKERAELAADNLDSALSLVRYIAWAIPALGFIGTVRGIGDALAHAEEAIKGDLSGVISALGLAFNSTLVALLLSMVLMFAMHLLQSRQESLIIELQTYCRDRLIDVMKVPSQEESRPALT